MNDETNQPTESGSTPAPIDAIEKEDRNTENAFPPAGFVDQTGAAKWLGVNPRTLREWIAEGKFAYSGETITGPSRVRCRIYSIAELECARGQMKQEIAAQTELPDGYVERDEAAKILGIAPDTLALWFTNGRLRCGMWIKSSSGKRRKVYPRAGLEQFLAQMAALNASREKPPAGFIDTDEACRMFGVTRAAFMIWKREGKVPKGTKWRSATAKYCRIYALDELEQIRESLRGADKVFRVADGRYHIPEGWVQLQEAARLFGVSEKTITRWESEGLITCGKNETGRRIKIYPRDELERILAENGRYSPPYPDPNRPGIYRIPLAGEGITRREAIIDAEDLPLVEGMTFHYSGFPDPANGRVATFNINGDSRLHQIIMGVSGNEWCVGHRNDDPLDCRRDNLVLRTRSESNAHRRKSKTFCGRPTTSQFKGVCWVESKGKWKAYIKKESVMRNLRYFDDEIAAAQAYDEAAQELFGEHARLNFPEGVDAWLEQQYEIEEQKPIEHREAA